MTATRIETWVEELKAGVVGLDDLEARSRLGLEGVLDRLTESYPVWFLDRTHRTQREIGVARKRRRSNRWETLHLDRCLLFTSESERITTVAAMTHVRFRPSRQEQGMIEMA